MECNKEEAIRAKEIAEKKMENRDFMGARKMAIKAQQLFPELENISQMLMVCDVHCSADEKLYGNEINWYAILKIEQTADEATIKKQYRKFALLLHPDKNNFSGAESAFKLIGEAQRVLLDREKRAVHDMKHRTFVSRPAALHHPPKQPNRTSAASHHLPKQPNRTSSYVPQHSFWSNTTSSFVGVNPWPQQQAQPGFSNDLHTFWTECAFCKVRFQYYREMINKYLRCHGCQKSFMAYEVNAQSAPHPANPQRKDVHNQGVDRREVRCKGNISVPQPAIPQQKNVQNQGSRREEVGSKVNLGSGNFRKESFPVNECSTGFHVEKMNIGRKKRKPVEESESSEIGSSSSDSEEEMVFEEHEGLNVGLPGEQNVRRSTRQKQNVSYTENLSDDDQLMTPSKRKKGNQSSYAPEEVDAVKEVAEMKTQTGPAADVKDKKEVNQKESASFEEILLNGNNKFKKENEKEKLEEKEVKRISEADNDYMPSSSKILDPEVYVYPDPDFNDFDKDRQNEHFAVGQIWAIYDSHDAMPRFYARIRKILTPGFKLSITWLEPDPKGVVELEWVSVGLPFSCGIFKNGNSENTEDRLMFSHLINWENISRRCTYKIYPRKGETWALFKNWDINWKSDPGCTLKYKFEFVEILSDFFEDVGTCVAYLGKVRGFVSLFSRMVREGTETFQIPPSELLRFSHRVPSFKMIGEKRKGVPEGSFELDPASLPTNIEEIDVDPENLNVNNEDLREVQTMMGTERSKFAHQADGKKADVRPEESSDSSPEDIEIPDQEFYNFDADKSQEMFQAGQLWALYSDEDGLPKYYCKIDKIDSFPEFKVRIKWLESCSRSKDIIWWHDKEMPICCGIFEVMCGKTEYADTSPFSHQIKTEASGKKNKYAIFPRTRQIWAVFKNWSAEMKCSDLKSCEYDIVEILEDNGSHIKVLLLERVEGFKTVFKAQCKGESCVTLEISQVDLLRFSHQIPAFKLTEEMGGRLRGSWELDSAALPLNFFRIS